LLSEVRGLKAVLSEFRKLKAMLSEVRGLKAVLNKAEALKVSYIVANSLKTLLNKLKTNKKNTHSTSHSLSSLSLFLPFSSDPITHQSQSHISKDAAHRAHER
jgi:hypothetical protein